MKTKNGSKLVRLVAISAVLMALLAPLAAWAVPTLQPPFDASYTLADVGAAPGVPSYYGGLTFKDGDPDTLLITGAEASAIARVYAIAVVRDVNHHITGFTGTAASIASAGSACCGGGDGGLTFGPGGVLFYTSYNGNRLEQIKPGSTASDKSINLTPLGVTISTGALAFVPAGFPGAGHMKILSFSGGTVYDATVSPDGSGTYDVAGVELRATTGGGPEGMVYVAAGNPQISAPTALITEYSYGRVSAFEVNATGDPVFSTRRDFVTGLSGPEGAAIDPLTGDLLFGTSATHIIVVRGFNPPVPPLDNFMCYTAKTTARTPKIGGVTVTLADQFQSGSAKVAMSAGLCTPAAVNGGTISDPDTLAKSYQIRPAFRHVARKHLTVSNDINPGGIQLDTIRPDRLLVPAAAGAAGFPAPPDTSTGLDHYECYMAKVTPKTPAFPKGVQATVIDEFTAAPKVLDVKKPTRLCVPVDKNGEGINDASAYLTCYQALPAKNQPKHTPVKGLYLADQLGTERLDTVKELELCVPSEVTVP